MADRLTAAVPAVCVQDAVDVGGHERARRQSPRDAEVATRALQTTGGLFCMMRHRLILLVVSAVLFYPPDRSSVASAQDQARQPKQEKRTSEDTGNRKVPAPETLAASEEDQTADRTRLNIRGTTDTAAGESRRNENINFNPIDNNALRDLNLRIGVSATVVQEFQPQDRYFSSEYGTPPQSPIHLRLAPVSAVHGSVYETHSNSVFSARSFFQVGGVKPARENNYGFNLGAPLGGGFRLLLDGAQQKARGSVNGNVLVPNANERTPLTDDPEVRPIVEKYLAAYPAELPNRPDIDDRALNTNSPQSIDTDRIAGTLDRGFSDESHLILRYALTSQRVQPFQFVAGQNPNSDVRAHSARITWTRSWSSSTATDFSIGFDRVRTLLEAEEHAVSPAISIWIIQSLGSSNIPVNRAINDFQYTGQLRKTGQKHLLTAGFSILRRRFNGRETNGHFGSFLFTDAYGHDAVTNLRMGIPVRFSITVGQTQRGFRNWGFAFYVGDRWRTTTYLTLSFGLRYEPVTQPIEINGLDSVPFKCDCNNLAPSFGLAYRLDDSWGVLRAAYAIQYGQIFPATYGQVRFNPPGNLGLTMDEPNLAHPLLGVDLAHLDPNTRSSLTEISPDLVVPYSHQYNFSWEPGSLRGLRVQLGYVGSRTYKLFSTWPMNRAHPVDGIPQTLATVNQRRPDPNHFTIRRIVNGSRAFYDAARISVILPERQGWSFDASYWFSKAIDLDDDFSATGVSSIPIPQSDLLIHEDVRAVSSFNQPHAFLGRGSFQLPASLTKPAWMRNVFGQWTISAVLLMKTGTPFSVFSGSDAPGIGNVDGESGDRVDVVDPSVLGRTIGDPDTSTVLLPRSAFGFMGPTALRGNIGRDTFRKGKIANVNAAIARSWKLGAQKSITFRAESVNLFNTPQFADPERNLVSKLFGRISNTLNVGRTLQFVLRVSF